MDIMKSFEMLMKQTPILLDGAMGTNLIAAGMPMGCCAEAWMLAHTLWMLIALQIFYRAARM